MRSSFRMMLIFGLLFGGWGAVLAAQADEKTSDHQEQDEHSHGEGETPSRAGPHKALLAISEEKGIQLSAKAKKRLGLAYETLSGDKVYTIPVQALVYSRDRTGVYRIREDWFKFIEVQKRSKQDSKVEIESLGLKSGDQIVVQGVGLLRVADLDAFSEEVGHGH